MKSNDVVFMLGIPKTACLTINLDKLKSSLNKIQINNDQKHETIYNNILLTICSVYKKQGVFDFQFMEKLLCDNFTNMKNSEAGIGVLSSVLEISRLVYLDYNGEGSVLNPVNEDSMVTVSSVKVGDELSNILEIHNECDDALSDSEVELVGRDE